MALGLAGALAIAGGACTAAASSSGPGTTPRANRPGGASAPRRDTFKVSIAKGTGDYAGDTGRATIYLHHASRTSSHVRVIFRGVSCQGSAHCLDLEGRLNGKLVRSANGVPDTGSRYLLTGRGTLTQLGHIIAHGWVQGTGFISRAHERMRVTLTNSSGTATLRGESPAVGGFTSP